MSDRLRLLVLRARTRGRLVAARDVRVGPGVRAEGARGARLVLEPGGGLGAGGARPRGAGIVLEPGAALGAGARITAVAGEVRLGRAARLGERAVIVSHAGVAVGE